MPTVYFFICTLYTDSPLPGSPASSVLRAAVGSTRSVRRSGTWHAGNAMPTGAADRPHPLPHDRPQHTAMRGAWRAVRLRHGFRDDAAVEEVDPAGGARDIAPIVGGDADRRGAGAQLLEDLHHGLAPGPVDGAGRLVCAHDG